MKKNAGIYIVVLLILAAGSYLLWMIFKEDTKKSPGSVSGANSGTNTGKKPAVGDLSVTDRPGANTGKKPAVNT